MNLQFGDAARSIFGGEIANVPLPGLPLVEILGNQRVLIENHLGVMAYALERICIKTKGGYIEVTGKCLKLTRMSNQQMLINGTIFSVNLCFGGVSKDAG